MKLAMYRVIGALTLVTGMLVWDAAPRLGQRAALGADGGSTWALGADPAWGPADSRLLAQANSDYAQQLLGMVNRVRSRAGLSPLQLNPQLSQAAGDHAQDMAQNNFLSHTGSNGSTMQSRVEATGYRWQTLGENVAAGQPTPRDVMRAWMASEGHRQNILNPDFTEMGVGFQENSAADMSPYWVQVFARPL